MSVACRALCMSILKRTRKVNACLIGQSQRNPQHVGKLAGEVFITYTVTGFRPLFAKFSQYYMSQLAYFLGKNGNVGHRGEISFAGRFNPAIDKMLRFFNGHFYYNFTIF